ncbi:hypothetical protein C8Q74DRAFT_1208584, partial [Fomes fomentarius]
LAFKFVYSMTKLLSVWCATSTAIRKTDQLIPDDVYMQWNFTYIMFSVALSYQRVVNHMMEEKQYG